LRGVEIIVKTMGNNKYEEVADVKLYANKKKGILLISDNKFFTRLWFHISNPFRYIFTGKIRY
jgi:hypothetical protein